MINNINFYKSLQSDYEKSTKIIYLNPLNDILLKIKKSEKGSSNKIIKALLPNDQYLIKKSYINDDHPNFINIKRKKDGSLMISYLTIKDVKSKILNKYIKDKFKLLLKDDFNIRKILSNKEDLSVRTCISYNNVLSSKLYTFRNFRPSEISEDRYFSYLSSMYINMYEELSNIIHTNTKILYSINEMQKNNFILLKILYNSIINDTNYIEDVKEYYGLNSKETKYINSKLDSKSFELLNLLKNINLYKDSSIRKQIKPGKFIIKLFNKGIYKPTEIEDFVELLSSEFIDISKDDIKIVRGPAIPYYYNEINCSYYKNYNKKRNNASYSTLDLLQGTINNQEDGAQVENNLGGGQLHNSCMRHNSCTDEQLDLYVDNPDTIGMLILFDYDKKVAGRCIIWTDGKTNMFDRIYADNNSTRHKMYKWLLNNNYINVSNSNKNYSGLNNNNKTTGIPIKNCIYEKYPYLDTFKYIDLKNKKLLTYHEMDSYESDKYLYSISSGGLSEVTKYYTTSNLMAEKLNTTDYINNTIKNYNQENKNIKNILKTEESSIFKIKLHRYAENSEDDIIDYIHIYSWNMNNTDRMTKSLKNNEIPNGISVLKYSIRNGTITSKKHKVDKTYKKTIEKLGIINEQNNLKSNKLNKEDANKALGNLMGEYYDKHVKYSPSFIDLPRTYMNSFGQIF